MAKKNPFPYKNVIWPAGSDNMGGLATEIYFVPLTALKSMPPFDPEDGITRKGKFEFNTSEQGFVKLYVTYKSGDLKSEPVGDIDGRCSKKSGSFFHPGTTEEMAKFARAVQNTPGVFIALDTEGNRVVIGDAVNPATVKAQHAFGKSPEDRKGWTISYEAYDAYPVVFYDREAEIPLAKNAAGAPSGTGGKPGVGG